MQEKRRIFGQSEFWKFAGLSDWTWCPAVEPYILNMFLYFDVFEVFRVFEVLGALKASVLFEVFVVCET